MGVTLQPSPSNHVVQSCCLSFSPQQAATVDFLVPAPARAVALQLHSGPWQLNGLWVVQLQLPAALNMGTASLSQAGTRELSGIAPAPVAVAPAPAPVAPVAVAAGNPYAAPVATYAPGITYNTPYAGYNGAVYPAGYAAHGAYAGYAAAPAAYAAAPAAAYATHAVPAATYAAHHY